MYRSLRRLALGLVAATLLAGTDTSRAEEARRFEFESYVQVAELFEQLDYTEATWQAGIRQVPRVFLADIPPRWRDTVSKSVTVKVKKQIFFRALAPLALRSNELILADRERLTALAETGVGAWSADDRAWLSELAFRYGVTGEASDEVTPDALPELAVRVDIIPLSLALSQAAEESGWGTSRFAATGNALFGQWTWGPHAMKPAQQRAKLGNYGIRAFGTPLESVISYMLNLNSHRAYTKLRVRRAELRAAGEEPTGWILAETLDKYSERGAEYVKSLHAIMRVNRLTDADVAYLSEGPDLLLVPIGEGASR